MASRCRSFSKPAFSLLKSAVNKPAFKATPMSYLPSTRMSINLSRYAKPFKRADSAVGLSTISASAVARI
ncbi:unnamed protein product [Malus baccata var. baccata]